MDLYPFEETVSSGAEDQAIIEKIDIGGISLIRATAKNFKDVIIVSSRNDYAEFLELLNENNGTTIDDRKRFAAKSFNVSSHYDTAIFSWFNKEETAFKHSITEGRTLRYGENPHQEGTFYGNLDEMFETITWKSTFVQQPFRC